MTKSFTILFYSFLFCQSCLFMWFWNTLPFQVYTGFILNKKWAAQEQISGFLTVAALMQTSAVLQLRLTSHKNTGAHIEKRQVAHYELGTDFPVAQQNWYDGAGFKNNWCQPHTEAFCLQDSVSQTCNWWHFYAINCKFKYVKLGFITFH